MSSKPSPDQIIQDLGGCGRYQMRISIVAHFMKCLICWSVSSMVIIAVIPPWWCDDHDLEGVTTYSNIDVTHNYTDYGNSSKYLSPYVIISENDTSADTYFQACETPRGRKCTKYKFDGTSTLVSEDFEKLTMETPIGEVLTISLVRIHIVATTNHQYKLSWRNYDHTDTEMIFTPHPITQKIHFRNDTEDPPFSLKYDYINNLALYGDRLRDPLNLVCVLRTTCDVEVKFDLVCDFAYIPSLMMSLQGAGALFGNLLAGQISDLFGRKRPFFGAVAITIVFNFVSYLSSHWTLFAATRFLVGFGGSAFMTTKYSLLGEFTLAQYRAWIIAFPSWHIELALFVGAAWLLKEWRYIQLATAILGLPCLLAWWIIPESFRWHLSHDRQEDAEKILRQVAKVNKKPIMTMTQLQEISLADSEEQRDRKYTFLDIFRSRYLVKVTLLMSFCWLSNGFVGYGVKFGIQRLSGSIYLNLFLFALSAIPSKFISIWLENRIGRRKTSILCYIITAVGGFTAGIVHYIDTPKRGSLINGFALLANLGIETAWGPIQTMTIELYPTVIRSIGFGTLSVLARIGGIIAPQFVFLSTKVPGIMFLMCGVVSTFSMVALFGLDETRNANLNDKISETNKKTAKN